jgi:hypothetical protein
MMGVSADVKFFGEELLEHYLPELHHKFKELNFNPSFFSFNWFTCLFQDKLSDPLSYSILDLLFIEGSHILPRVAITICYMIKEKILACNDFCKFLYLISKNRGAIRFDGGSSE